MLAQAEVEREARRVLRKLAGARQLLFAQGTRFVVGRGPGSSSRLSVAADMVEAFARAGWIAPDGPGRYVLAQAGRALLTRAGADGFAAQHRLEARQTLEDSGEAVTVNLGESPLARLRHRGLVDATGFAAGERLRRDFTLAQLTPRMGVNWDAPVVSADGARAPTASATSR